MGQENNTNQPMYCLNKHTGEITTVSPDSQQFKDIEKFKKEHGMSDKMMVATDKDGSFKPTLETLKQFGLK